VTDTARILHQLSEYDTSIAMIFGSDLTFEVAQLNGILPLLCARLKELSQRRKMIYVLTADAINFSDSLPDGIEHVPLGKWRAGNNPVLFVLTATLFSALGGVLALIRLKNRIRVVVVSPLFPVTALVRRFTRLPVVLCLPYYPGWHPSFSIIDFFKKMLYIASATNAITSSDLVIAPTLTLKRVAIALGAKDEAIVLGNRFPVNKELLKPLNSSINLRNVFNIEAQCKVLLFHGRLVRLKGLDCLLRALAILKDRGKFHLLLLGRGPEEQRLRQLAVDLNVLGLVHFVGPVSNRVISGYLADADTYVFPSLSEGLPKSLLEAMLMAKPIVASRIAGVTEFLKHGENALLFEASKPDDLAEKILEITTNDELAKRLGSNARLRAIQLSREEGMELYACLA
jgi:glycosyltransferase involved in cell wall biosynthesis